MTDVELLRRSLTDLSREVETVDLSRRVHEGTRSLRRRRALTTAVAAVLALIATAAAVAGLVEARSARPAPPAGPVHVDLGSAPVSGLRGAALSVLDRRTGEVWLVATDGRAARLPVRPASLTGAIPTLSSVGSLTVAPSHDSLSVVRGEQASITELAVPDAGDLWPALSPDGESLAYARAPEHAAGVDLTVRPVTGRYGSGPQTITIPDGRSSGRLAPVVWRDDGSALLVLEGLGVTRVDVVGSTPVARQSVAVTDDLVLSHGWAVAPDLSRFLMSQPELVPSGARRWLVMDTSTGRLSAELERPARDRLIGWQPGGRLVWWHPGHDAHSVVTTDLDGTGARRLLLVSAPGHRLAAAWRAAGP